MEYKVQAEGLLKRYGRGTTALAGVDFAIRPGTVFGLLGPNGAGKTTIVRILATLLRPDGGSALVGGFDVVRQPDRVRRLIGLTGQYAAVDEDLTGSENLRLAGRLLGMSRAEARRRAAGLLARFDLTEAGGRLVKTYSGGMRRRLDLAVSLVGRPEVLFLDEPTTGLDPAGRNSVWALIRDRVADGVTVLLTTQNLLTGRACLRWRRSWPPRPGQGRSRPSTAAAAWSQCRCRGTWRVARCWPGWPAGWMPTGSRAQNWGCG